MELSERQHAWEPLVGSIFGFRWWRVQPGGHLRSPWHGGHRWRVEDNSARCLVRRRVIGNWHETRDHHDAPDRSCRCGFYALWEMPNEQHGDMLWDIAPETSGGRHQLLLGVVEAWGKILLASGGFRAQRARPVAVATGSVPPTPDADAVRLRFPVRSYTSVAELARDWQDRIADGRRLASWDTAA
jgi:hypothetical protein